MGSTSGLNIWASTASIEALCRHALRHSPAQLCGERPVCGGVETHGLRPDASLRPRFPGKMLGWWVGMDGLGWINEKWYIYIYTKYIERMMNDGCGCKSWVKSEDFRFSSSSWAVESCRFHVVVQLRWLQMMICAGVELQQWELLDYQPVRG